MDMSEFARISNQNQCPVCFGSNINKDKYRGGWGARISAWMIAVVFLHFVMQMGSR
jgi:hypothetical protein